MIILRRKNPKSLYWLSENLGLSEQPINPAVPQNFLVQRKCIDHKTQRILLYDSLDDAISVFGLGGRDLVGKTLGVYRPRGLRDENTLPTDLSQCPYRDILEGHEYWCLLPLRMEKIADIGVLGVSGERKFRYGLRNQKNAAVQESKLTKYSWKEILPEWDRKGKTKKL